MVTISKFFAEVGFKVNTTQLKQTESVLKGLEKAFKKVMQETKLAEAQEKVRTQAAKTATQAAKAQEAQEKSLTAAIKKQTAELRLRNLEERNQERAARKRQSTIKKFLGKSKISEFAPILGWGGLFAAARSTGQLGLNYRDFARQTGLSLERLTQYQAAGEMVGSSLTKERVASEIKELQQRAQAITWGEGNISAYQKLGIQVRRRDAYGMIEDIRKGIKRLDDTTALTLIRQIGLSDDWLHILRMTKEEFDSIQSVMLSEKQIKSISRLGLAFRQVGSALNMMKNQYIARISGGLSEVLSRVKDIALYFAKMISAAEGSEKAVKAITAAVAALMLVISPLGTALVGLLLILEDYWGFTQGKESFFNWDSKNLQNLRNYFEEIFNRIENFNGEEFEKFLGRVYDRLSDIAKLAEKVLQLFDTRSNPEGKKYKKEPGVLGKLGESLNLWRLKTADEELDNLSRPKVSDSKSFSNSGNINSNNTKNFYVNSPEEAAKVDRNSVEGMYDDEILPINQDAYMALQGDE